jgi:hypothetical protein
MHENAKMQRMRSESVHTRYGLRFSVLLSVGPVPDVCCQCLLLLSTQSWCRFAIGLHVLHVSAYCGHHQVHRAFTITRSSIWYARTSILASELYRYVVCVMLIYYDVY